MGEGGRQEWWTPEWEKLGGGSWGALEDSFPLGSCLPTEIWDLFHYCGEGHLSGRKETGSEGPPQSYVCKSPITVGPGQPIPLPPTLPSFLLDSPRTPQDLGSRERGDYWSMTGPVNQAKQNLQIVQHLPLLPSPQYNTPFSYSDSF